jgi:hypothetical protein
MRRWRVAVALLAVALIVAWSWGSPYWTLSQLKRAADARDLATLSAHVDYPLVRKNLHQQLDARLAAPAGGDDPLAGLGRAIARRLSDPVIDALVTPEGLQAAFASAPAAKSSSEAQPALVRAGEMRLHRESIGRFRLQRSDGTGPQLVFALEGLSWRLVAVRLPKDVLPF